MVLSKTMQKLLTLIPTNKGNTMQIGDTYTTSKSHITGTIEEIIERNGQTVLLLDTPEGERYTTVS